MLKIGYMGRQRSGKDYQVAKAMAKTGGELYRMASPLKVISKSLFELKTKEDDHDIKDTKFAFTEEELLSVFPLLEKTVTSAQSVSKVELLLDGNEINQQKLKKAFLEELAVFAHKPSLLGQQSRLVKIYRISPREFQQTIGTNLCRNRITQNFWILNARYHFKEYEKSGAEYAYCPDVRFANESLEFDKLAFVLRTDTDNLKRLTKLEVDALHESEFFVETIRDIILSRFSNIQPNTESELTITAKDLYDYGTIVERDFEFKVIFAEKHKYLQNAQKV